MARNRNAEAGMNAKEFQALRRRRNYAVLGCILFLCLLFYVMTFVKVANQ